MLLEYHRKLHQNYHELHHSEAIQRCPASKLFCLMRPCVRMMFLSYCILFLILYLIVLFTNSLLTILATENIKASKRYVASQREA